MAEIYNFFGDIWDYLRETYFCTDFGIYDNFDLTAVSATLSQIIIGVMIGICIAAGLVVYEKHFVGRAVRLALKKGAKGAENAKTLAELGCARNIPVRLALLRRESTLRRFMHYVGQIDPEEAFLAEQETKNRRKSALGGEELAPGAKTAPEATALDGEAAPGGEELAPATKTGGEASSGGAILACASEKTAPEAAAPDGEGVSFATALDGEATSGGEEIAPATKTGGEASSGGEDSPKKRRFMREAINFAETRFFIPQELCDRAAVRYDNRGSSLRTFFLTVLVAIVGGGLLIRFLPVVFRLIDNIITLLS